MIVKHIFTNDIYFSLNYFELYCIKKGISYVKLESELHFGEIILFFHDKKDIKVMQLSEIQDNFCVNLFEEQFLPEAFLDLSSSLEETNRGQNKEKSYFQYYKNNKNKNNINTMGYPNIRIRKRF